MPSYLSIWTWQRILGANILHPPSMLPLCPNSPQLLGSFEKRACTIVKFLSRVSFNKTYVEVGSRSAWESYLLFCVWADNHDIENLEAIILLGGWLDSLSDNGGGTQAASTTPAAHVRDLDVLPGTAHWGGDGDISMSSNECNKTLDSKDHPDVASTPSPTWQLFAGTPSPATRKSADSCQAMDNDFVAQALGASYKLPALTIASRSLKLPPPQGLAEQRRQSAGPKK